ncbi:hypothetical protein [Pontiella sp.]|uniref:hypothetical protein n=1 Tax=Pontiella sp. TaxID=2837462 RepID=UPI00356134E6
MKKNVMGSVLAGVVFAGAMSCGAASGQYSARISVTGQLEKERDSSKNESTKSTAKTKSESQHFDLKVTVANTGKEEASFDLEYYFFARHLTSDGDKGEPVLVQKGNEAVTLAGMSRDTIPVVSSSLSWSETKTTSSGNSNNNSSSSSQKKTVSGSVYDGYVMLLRADGEIVAKYSPDRKLLTDEAIASLATATVSAAAPAKSGAKQAGGKRKKK